VISDISYDHPAWQPRLVRDVSARAGDDQVIHKVLLDRQGPRRFLPILEQVHEYEDLYYMERELAGPGVAEVNVRQAARRKYLPRILAMPDPLRYGADPRPTAPRDPDRDPQRTIVSAMNSNQQGVLTRKIGELFELYGIPRLGALHLTQWETVYKAADGTPTRAVVQINNGTGSYDVYRNGALVARGELSKIEVSDTFKNTIAGRWKLGGLEGYFQWTFTAGQPDAFAGEWGYERQTGPAGEWKGQRTLWQ
jgi:hypothetical protein